MRLMRNAAALGIAAFIMHSAAMPMACQAQEPHSPDKTSWRLTVTPEKFDKFVDFPNTQIGDVIRVQVFHQPVDGSNAEPKPWKSFYYDRSGKLLGARQIRQVTFPADTSGSLRIHKGPEMTPAIANATANAVVRLFLGLYLNKNFPHFLVVDNDMFNQFVDGMRHNGWKSFTLPRPRNIQPKPKAILIVRTADNSRFEYMMYQ